MKETYLIPRVDFIKSLERLLASADIRTEIVYFGDNLDYPIILKVVGGKGDIFDFIPVAGITVVSSIGAAIRYVNIMGIGVH